MNKQRLIMENIAHFLTLQIYAQNIEKAVKP